MVSRIKYDVVIKMSYFDWTINIEEAVNFQK